MHWCPLALLAVPRVAYRQSCAAAAGLKTVSKYDQPSFVELV